MVNASADDNLSIGSGSDGSSKASGTSYGYVRDGDISTYWSPGGSTGRISIKYKSATTVASVIIKEAAGFEGNIGSWNLVNHKTGGVLASGSGAGTINLDPVSLKKISLEITGSSGTPAVAEFETYAGSSDQSPTPEPSHERVDLQATAGNDSVKLSWSLVNITPQYQQVYRDTDSNPKGRTRIGITGSDTKFVDSDVTAGTTYYYWIKVLGTDGTITNSPAISATIPNDSSETPPTPTPTPTPTLTPDPTATTVSSADGLVSALESAKAGSTIYIRGGTYYFGETITLNQSGSKSKNIYLRNYPADDERPMLDFSAMSESGSNRGLKLQGDYWHIYGIDVRKAGDNCLYITGSNNLIEFSTFSECADTGVQLAKGASDNLIKNVDSYYNADSSLENADGFAAKLDVGDGNKFYGCRAWNNLDDGFDGYLRGANNVTTTYENTWVIRNGYLKDGSLGAGDGNGFKTGGSDDKDLKHNAVFINTIAAGNAVDGYDHNSNRGKVTIYNAIAHDNGRNINFSSKNQASKLTIKNTISIGGSNSLKASSTDIEANSWQDGRSAEESDFVSMDIDELLKPRKADGSLPDVKYFKLVDDSDLIDAGVDVGLPYNGSAPDIGAFESE
jgi:hypothetical protein